MVRARLPNVSNQLSRGSKSMAEAKHDGTALSCQLQTAANSSGLTLSLLRSVMRTVMRKCIFDAASGRAVWQNNFVRTYWGAKTEDVLKPFETCATDLSVQHRLKEFKADH